MPFIWTPPGQSPLTLAAPAYRLRRVSGLGPDAIVQRQRAPSQHGTSIVDVHLAEREVVLELVVLAADLQAVYNARRALVQAFNPVRRDGVLTWQQSGRTYAVDCQPAALDMPLGNPASGDAHQVAMVSLIAPNPFLYDPTQVTASFSTSANVTNEGDDDTPIELRLYGPSNDAGVTNATTGKALTLTQPIEAGQHVRIRTHFGRKSVVLVSNGTEVEVPHWLAPGYEFWTLAPGANTLVYSEAQGGGSAEVTFNHRFIGA